VYVRELLHALLHRIFPANFGERRAISVGYLKAYSIT
jgi:hypothetical protein